MKLATFPQEIEVWYILPAIRRELAIELAKGLNQKKIADILHITEPTVSHYIHSKRGQEIQFNEEIKNLIKEAAQTLTKDENMLMREVMKISEYIKDSRFICQIHKNYSALPEQCGACFD